MEELFRRLWIWILHEERERWCAASDKYCPSFVVDEEAFAAAVATVVRTPLKDFMVIKHEWAATRIQAVFRGFLVSGILRHLANFQRFALHEHDALCKASFEGPEGSGEAASYISWSASEKASSCYSKVHAGSCASSSTCQGKECEEVSRRKSCTELLNEHRNQVDPVKQAEQGWCDIPGTVEEVKTKLKMRQEGAIKRDRTMTYSHSTQESRVSASPNSKAAKPVTPLKHRSRDSKSSGGSLLERWIASKPWESRLMEEIYFDSPDMTPLSRKNDDPVLPLNSYQQNGLVKARRNGVTTRISSKSLTTSQSTPSSSAKSSDCMYDDSPASTSSTSEPSTNNTAKVEATEETNICKPSYMNMTASTKAKLKACRFSQNSKRLFMDDCLSHSNRTDFLSGDTRSCSGSYPSTNIWKDLYATPLRASYQK
ncbi:IQ motif, EF-hand binding site [Sesbania bispinosa]|nr:IQ motif, EF-hand binding site [Sesbania bispinosa]